MQRPLVQSAVYFAAAAVGGLVGELARLPAGSLIGSVLAAAVVRLTPSLVTSGPPHADVAMRVGLALLGCIVGLGVTRGVVAELTAAIPVAAAAMAATAGLSLGLGWLLWRSKRTTLATGLYGMAPGGAAEMAAVGAGDGADGAVVVALHVARVVAILVAVPIVASAVR